MYRHTRCCFASSSLPSPLFLTRSRYFPPSRDLGLFQKATGVRREGGRGGGVSMPQRDNLIFFIFWILQKPFGVVLLGGRGSSLTKYTNSRGSRTRTLPKKGSYKTNGKHHFETPFSTSPQRILLKKYPIQIRIYPCFLICFSHAPLGLPVAAKPGSACGCLRLR